MNKIETQWSSMTPSEAFKHVASVEDFHVKGSPLLGFWHDRAYRLSHVRYYASEYMQTLERLMKTSDDKVKTALEIESLFAKMPEVMEGLGVEGKLIRLLRLREETAQHYIGKGHVQPMRKRL